MIDPNEFKDVLGKSFVDKQNEPVFEMGRRKVSRLEAGILAGGKIRALQILEAAMREVGVESLAKLRKLGPAGLGSIKGVGVTTLFAAMCLLDADGVDVRTWYGEEAGTFNTVKAREKRRETEVSKRRRSRRRVSGEDGQGDLRHGT